MSNYYMTDLTRFKKQITSTREARDYLLPRFIGLTNECVYLLCLDKSGRILHGDFINEGTVDISTLSPRTIVEIALRVGASRIILSHNHPRGFALPSSSDVASTLELKNLLETLGIELADHLIVSENDCVSLRESKILT